jgi:hypothetical protein
MFLNIRNYQYLNVKINIFYLYLGFIDIINSNIFAGLPLWEEYYKLCYLVISYTFIYKGKLLFSIIYLY